MLYVTTREKYDAYTAPRTLAADRGPNGGLYLPFRMPHFDGVEIAALKEQTFGQTVAQILNTFYTCRLTGWDVDFCVGRYPVKLLSMSQKVYVAELWRNLDGSYEKMEKHLAARVSGCDIADVHVTSWLRLAIRIAVLFGTYGEFMRQDGVDAGDPVDIAVAEGDFSLPIAVWYARQMGLPVAAIVCSCGDNSGAWELLHQGELRLPAPKAEELERLIYGALGVKEAQRYGDALANGGVYALRPGTLDPLRKGIFSAVVSDSRQESVISNVYRTNTCILAPDAAMGYGGLMDYRGKTGTSRHAILISDSNPGDHGDMVAASLNISVSELMRKLDRA